MSESSQYFDCLICSPCSLETKILKNQLLRRMRREINLLQDRSSIFRQHQEKQGFKQILKIVFGGDSIGDSRQCQHRKFHRFLLQKLECSKEVLNFVCEKLAYSIAQKNYHLELVGHQIKNIAESISQGDLLFQLNNHQIAQFSRSEKWIAKRKSERRLTRTLKKTSLQNNKNQVLSQSKIQIQTKNEVFPSYSSLTFIPLQNSQQNIANQNQINLGYNYYFTPFPFFYGKSQ